MASVPFRGDGTTGGTWKWDEVGGREDDSVRAVRAARGKSARDQSEGCPEPVAARPATLVSSLRLFPPLRLCASSPSPVFLFPFAPSHEFLPLHSTAVG